MSVERANNEGNLLKLKDQLKACARKHGFPGTSEEVASLAECIASEIPLTNSAGLPSFESILKSGRIISQRGLSEGKDELPTTDEIVLGTDDDVFLYAAPFCYPQGVCGFLFNPSLEDRNRHNGVATPFDSGALVKIHKIENPRQFLAEHTLSIPEHRELIADSLKLLFDSPWDYVDGKESKVQSHFGLSRGDRRRFTHEVRIPKEVSVRQNLKAVFIVSGRANSKIVENYLAWCEGEGVDLVSVPTQRKGQYEALKQACIDYVRSIIQSRYKELARN